MSMKKKVQRTFISKIKKQILITAVPYNTRHLLAYVIFNCIPQSIVLF